MIWTNCSNRFANLCISILSLYEFYRLDSIMAQVLTITQKCSGAIFFTDLVVDIGLDATQKQMLNNYNVSGPKEFEKYPWELNRTFATASTQALQVYYSIGIMNRLVGCLNYYWRAVYSMHCIPDMDQVTLASTTELGQIYNYHQLKFDDDEDEIELAPPKLKGASNWIDYMDTFVPKWQVIESARGFPLSYLIDDTPRQVRHKNAAS